MASITRFFVALNGRVTARLVFLVIGFSIGLFLQPREKTKQTDLPTSKGGQIVYERQRSARLSDLRDCPVPSNNTLMDLAENFQPTKFGYVDGEMKYLHVGFQRFYPLWMEEYRGKHFKMLEIGLDSGKGSLLWKAYFPCAEIWGLEYKAGLAATEGARAINTVQGDQGDPAFLKNEFIRQSGGNFDIIVDDGGHHYEQQKTSYEILFQHALKPGGLYIIEDIETSYWAEGVGLYGKPVTRGGQSEPTTIINQFKKVVDVVNRKFYDQQYRVFGVVDHLIQQLTFTQNAIILVKISSSDCLYAADYIWPHNLAADCPARDQKGLMLTNLDGVCR